MDLQQKPAFGGIILLLLVAAFISGGTVFYHFVEGLSWIDAWYFSVITATTVGYGNNAPTTTEGKIFTIFYIFFSILIVFTFINHFSQRTRKSNIISRLFSEKDKSKE